MGTEIVGGENCLEVNGISLVEWTHKAPFPFVDFDTNVDRVTQIILSHSNATVSVDGLNVLDMTRLGRGVDVSDENSPLLSAFERSKAVVLVGDFTAQYEESRLLRKEVADVGYLSLSTILAAGLLHTLTSVHKKEGSRTTNMRLLSIQIGLAAAAGITLPSLLREMVIRGQSKAIADCDNDTTVFEMTSLIDKSPETIDLLVARTALSLVKQTHFSELSSTHGPQISIWGTTHLIGDLPNRIKEAVQKPCDTATKIIGHEVQFLKKNGLGISEIVEQCKILWIAMASTYPTKVVADGDSYRFVVEQQGVFIDQSILGISPEDPINSTLEERIKNIYNST